MTRVKAPVAPSVAAARATARPEAGAPFDGAGNALIVKLDARPDLAALDAMPRGAARKSAAFEALQRTAAESQRPLVAIASELQSHGMITGFTSLYSPNALVVNPKPGQENVVRNRFAIDGVKAIYENDGGDQVWPAVTQATHGAGIVSGPAKPKWGFDLAAPGGDQGEGTKRPVPIAVKRGSDRGGRGGGTRLPDGILLPPGFGDLPILEPEEPSAPKGATYGLKLVGAPQAWKQGADGSGLVFGSIDSGADFTHPALKAAYRGTAPDGSVSHDYNWMDFGDDHSRTPIDVRGHGTHTLGSAVGRDGTAEIGVAPGARWIAVRGTTGQVDDALAAMQWMQAPTKLDGGAPDPARAPDVVGMSWWMGNPRQELFRESIQGLRAAGIEVVKSAGNQGPDASTITSPGHFPEIFAIASVDGKGKVAGSSSRGPALIPKGSGTPKPDFAAPGVDVISAAPGGGYALKSGTSMAQPHFSGAVLDILSRYPQLTHDQLTQVLAAGATDAGTPGRDAEYGQGIINIPASLTAAAKLVGDGAAATKAPAKEPAKARAQAA